MSTLMSDDNEHRTERDGDNIAKDETNDIETKETQTKEPKSVSFNKDVHVKRFGKPRESRSTSIEHKPPTRKEPFTHLSEQELIDEANKVIEQAGNITCTADHPPEKFFSLPHRKKSKEPVDRRNSDEGTEEKKPLGRSTSDVSPKKRKERTSLSTLFRKAQRNKSPDTPVKVKPIVKRSKSDVSDLKSNTSLNNTQPKPIRKRSGSETEEFLKSLRNKKTQLSPIIESSPREDYFKKTPPLDTFLKKKLTQQNSNKSDDQSNKEKVINPIEKPPRYKSPEKEPKPPVRTKRGKSLEKELSPSPPITETPRRKTDIKKTLLVDEIDNIRGKDINPVEIKDRIKDSIRKIEENIYGSKDMIHSSQQPPEKPPLTRGHTVDPIVRILKEDQHSSSKKQMLSHQSGSVNQPFSYTRPSLSPDPNLFVRNTSPDRVPSPVNKMTGKGVVYAAVVRDHGENGTSNVGKQTIHKTYSPSRERFGNVSDEDEGLGYEDRYKISPNHKNSKTYKRNDNNFDSLGDYKVTDSPIRPRFREYKLTSFNDFEPTYANEYPTKEDRSHNFIDTTLRGRGDGMDNKRKPFVELDSKIDPNFNELSHRRQLLESRLNARKFERRINTGEPLTRYLTETDPIYEAEKRMKATEKYVNETARYYKQTLEKDGYTESSVTEDYNKYDSDNHKSKYSTETKTFEKAHKDEIDRRNYLDEPTRYIDGKKLIPPEPEYEPPSLETVNAGKLRSSPNDYSEKKYKVNTKNVTSGHDTLQSGQKYNGKKKESWFGKRKGHYASNPEINQERDDDYANTRYDPKHPGTYHNSLKREKNKQKQSHAVQRHDSGDSRDYYREARSPRRDIDSRLVDSGIENDFRKDSSGEIPRSRLHRHESDDDVRNTSLLLESERQHTEDNYPSEQIYANGEYVTRFERSAYPRKEYAPRERSADDGSRFDPRRFDRSPSRIDDKVSAKPPKAKKLSGLEKVKQLFSRDSSKKSKSEKELAARPRTRVLKSPEVENSGYRRDSGYRRYRDPEPSDDERRQRSEDIDRYRSSDPHDSEPEKYHQEYREDRRTDRREDRRTKTYREERRRYGSSDRESDLRSNRPSVDGREKMIRSKTAGPLDSPALAERYRERRRLATPSPTPSPPLRHPPATPAPPATTAGNWFKSLDRLTRKRGKNNKVEKENGATTEDEATARKTWSKPTKPLNSPAKNLRFFGDTDQDSDSNLKHSTVTKSKSHPQGKPHTLLRKTTSNSSGCDEVDKSVLSNKSSSLSNLHKEEDVRNKRNHKRNLHNISEIHSNSETESNVGRKVIMKPPMSPYDRSRSHSSSKTLKASKSDVRRHASRGDLRSDDRGSSSELRSSKQELSRQRRRTPGNQSGESSTEGDSSHQSQRSVVYLHATTVGDIPDPGALARNRSRDDVSSVNSSNLQVRTTQKSFSLFAPWTPKHYSDQHDVHYAQKPRKPTKEYKPRPDDRSTLQKKRSYSQTTLTRKPQNSRLSSSNTTLYRKPETRGRDDSVQSATLSRTRNKKSQSNEVLNGDSDSGRISRSISMPKDKNKKAGWFNLTVHKNKKPEVNTRVR